MRALISITAAALIPLPLWAQTDITQQEVDKGWLVELIEDTLSDVSRDVQIQGFSGALSSNARIERLTISDQTGIWLDAQGLSLVWDRGALLGGALEIQELSADLIRLPRLPVADPDLDLPPAQATPFSLPELPVSVQIDALDVARIELGTPILGQEMALHVNGSATLSEGAGQTRFDAARIDDRADAFFIQGSYSNQSGDLQLQMELDEAADGLVSRLIGLPGHPAVALSLNGGGPLDRFDADLSIATDGTERVAGQMQIISQADPNTQDETRSLDLDIGGDVTALFAPEYRDFFGPDIRLRANASRLADGAMQLHQMDLTANAIRLTGSARLSPDGWPQSLSIQGVLSDDNRPVLLPLAGPKTYVDVADLSVTFDDAVSDVWQVQTLVAGLVRDGVRIDALGLGGEGTLTDGTGTDFGALNAALSYRVSGLDLDDPGMAQALGTEINGSLTLDWSEGAPLELDRFLILGPGVEFLAQASLADGSVQTSVLASTRDLARFSTLSGQDLAGSGEVAVTGTLRPLDGIIDMFLSLTAQDLSLGIDQIDPALQGENTLALALQRDLDGTRIQGLTLRNDQVAVDGNLTLTGSQIFADLDARIHQLGVIAPGLTGAADLSATLTPQGDMLLADIAVSAPDTVLQITADIAHQQDFAIDAVIDGAIEDLRRYNALTGQSLTGAANLSIEGTFQPDTLTGAAFVTAQTRHLGLGNASIDPLLRGTGRVDAEVSVADTGHLTIQNAVLRFPNVTGRGSFDTDGSTGAAQFEARLADIGLVAPGLDGAVTASGTANMIATGAWDVAASTNGPGSAGSQLTGRVLPDGSLNMALTGTVPLALANRFIEPRRILGNAQMDLTLRGTPGINAISGTISTAQTRLSVPTFSQAIEDINGTITLNNGRAGLAIQGQFPRGGRAEIAGPVGLNAPYLADLSTRITDLVLRDPEFYETIVDAAVAITGPLTGGARITGDVTLGQTEVQISSSAISSLGELPEITHLDAPAGVRQTLDRAGISLRPLRETTTGATRPYDLDIRLNAPSRIFVRGRGLDAELGGSLRLTGTTQQMVPLGQFALLRGRLDILQQRFTLTEGAARIEGDFTPFLTLTASTETPDGINVQVILEGPANSPDIRFESQPELPQDEVLAHLLFGRNISEMSPLQAVQLASAISTLAGRGGGGLISQFREGVGLDDLDITTDETGNAALRAGAYINENIYTNVTVDSSGGTEIELNLDITDTVTARGRTTSDGETAVGVFFERDF